MATAKPKAKGKAPTSVFYWTVHSMTILDDVFYDVLGCSTSIALRDLDHVATSVSEGKVKPEEDKGVAKNERVGNPDLRELYLCSCAKCYATF